MSALLKRMLFPYMAPAGEADGGGGSAVIDRGDSYTPTDAPDPVDPPAPTADPVDPDPTDPPVDPDPDPTDPPADPAAAADPAAPKPKDSRMPLARHKEILAKERETRANLEARLAQYERGSEVAAISTDITALENTVLGMDTEYANHMAAGELKEATAVMAKIRAAERSISDAKAELRIQASTAQITEQARYDTALERVENAYDVLNPDHDDYDKAKLLEVVEWKLFYERQKNYTPTKALQEAVVKIMGKETSAQEHATEVKPNVSEKDVAAARKRDAVAKTLNATNRTPANTNKTGLDSNKAGGALTADNVMKMSQEEFKALPDDVLSRMRGDMI